MVSVVDTHRGFFRMTFFPPSTEPNFCSAEPGTVAEHKVLVFDRRQPTDNCSRQAEKFSEQAAQRANFGSLVVFASGRSS